MTLDSDDCIALVNVLTALFTIATLMSYVVICAEYPRGSIYDSDPVWLVVLKIWGGMAVFLLFSCFWWYVFSSVLIKI